MVMLIMVGLALFSLAFAGWIFEWLKSKKNPIEKQCRCKNCGFPIDEEKEHCLDCENFFKYN